MYKIIITSLVFLVGVLFPTFTQADYIMMPPAVTVSVKPEEVIVQELKPIELIKQTFGANHVMVKIAMAESKGCTQNVNPRSSARGCFQILKGTFAAYKCVGDRMIPKDNIACAKKIFERSGTQPWNASKHVWGKVALAK